MVKRFMPLAKNQGDYSVPSLTTLTPSGPITSSANGQVFEGLDISGNAASVITHDGVILRNCRINYKSGFGVNIHNCARVRVENVVAQHVSMPTSGALGSENESCFRVADTVDFVAFGVHCIGGSAGLSVQDSTNPRLYNIQGEDFRGPKPKGQLIQFNNCTTPLLDGFSNVNDLTNSWPEDNVNCYHCTDPIIRNGLVDGNNAPSGAGVIFDETSGGLCEYVDAVHMGNGGFTAYATGVGHAANNNTFDHCRVKDGHLSAGGRGLTASNGLSFQASADTGGVCTGNVYTNCQYYNPANPANISYVPGATSFTATNADFTPRAPLNQTWPWESYANGPYVAVFNGPNNVGVATVLTTGSANPTVVGKVFGISSRVGDVLSYSIASDTSGKLSINSSTGVVSTNATMSAGAFSAVFKVTGSLSGAAKAKNTSAFNFVVTSVMPGTTVFTAPKELYNGTYWSVNRATRTDDIADPFGGTTATKLLETAVTGDHQAAWDQAASKTTLVNGTAYCLQGLLKSVGGRWGILTIFNSGFTSSIKTWFDLTNGLVGTHSAGAGWTWTNATIEAAGDGFYYCRMFFTDTAGHTGPFYDFQTTSGDGVSAGGIAGDVTKGLIIVGNQCKLATIP